MVAIATASLLFLYTTPAEAQTMNFGTYDPVEGPMMKSTEGTDGDVGNGMEGLHDEYLADLESRQTSALQLRNEGRIASMSVPENWQLEKSTVTWETKSKTTAFNPASAGDTRLACFDSGANLTAQTAESFKSLLNQPNKTIYAETVDATGSKQIRGDRSQLNSLNELLGPLNDPTVFHMAKAATANVNGQRALVIDGQFVAGGKQYHGVMFPADNTYTRAQEVFYSASQANFAKYSETAMKAINSIRFKY
jgi:hypothetical protein